jgi:hypothetical protein
MIFLRNIQTDSGAHTASYTMDAGGCFPEGKPAGTGHSSPSTDEVKISGAKPPLPYTLSRHGAKLINPRITLA